MTTTSTVGTAGANSNSATSSTSAASAAVYARVQKVMSSQNAAAAKLNAALTNDQTKLSGLGQLQSALATYQAVAQSLVGGGLNAITFPPGTATASSDKTAQAATYALNVQQLAQGQLLTSAGVPSETAPIGSDAATTITVDYGSTDGGAFTPNSAAKSQTITIDSSNNTPDGIAAALQQAGINAKVVPNADGSFALAISGPSGAANSMRIGVSGDAAVGKLLAYDPAGAQSMTQTSAAQDAKLTVGGVAVTSATNTVTGAIGGVTLNLTAVGKTSLSVAPSATQVSANVNAFVSAYNALNSKLQTLQAAGLGNDPAVKQVGNQIAQLLKTGGSSSSAITALKAAGVTQDSNGNLQVDATKLAAAANANPSALNQLVSNSKGTGLADQLGTLATGFSSANGVITRETASTKIDLNNVTNKRSVLTTALTAQANALVALYTAQAQAGDGSGGGASSLWDML
ncbi:flagellar filament capping protein FliD [Rugamonas sp.]|uniref:flagellar filament capping protein FliD n=1 Tax=Rugamonas sp. TaxID=1926287 RepID=UPI0025F58810|nr:flagellar filament capping protein FliD [Rugamonas sp.]